MLVKAILLQVHAAMVRGASLHKCIQHCSKLYPRLLCFPYARNACACTDTNMQNSAGEDRAGAAQWHGQTITGSDASHLIRW